jgi:hypothetical protein
VLPEPELPELLVPVPVPVLPALPLLPLALPSEPLVSPPRIELHAETPSARASRLAINTLWCFRFMFNSF